MSTTAERGTRAIPDLLYSADEQDLRDAVGIVLEVSKHLGEIGGPCL